MKKQIIAAGDGLLDDKNQLMNLYILAQSQKENPKICIIPTASGDNLGLIKGFYSVFDRFPCETDHFSLFSPSDDKKDVRKFILSQDILYITGGNSKCLLALWRDWGLDEIIKEAYENGTVLSGGSAGSVCWFEQCITDSFPGTLSPMDCLGLLPYSNCPHFASEKRREAYEQLITNKMVKPGYAADDFAALHFVDGKLERCVSRSFPAKCYYYNLDVGNFDDDENKICIKTELDTKFLGNKEIQEELIWNAPCFNALIE